MHTQTTVGRSHRCIKAKCIIIIEEPVHDAYTGRQGSAGKKSPVYDSTALTEISKGS